jgi:hypothetical protein
MISFFASLPEEIEESAEIDGATEFSFSSHCAATGAARHHSCGILSF